MTNEQKAVRHETLHWLGRYRTSFKKFELPVSRVTRPHDLRQTIYTPPLGFITRSLFGDRIIR